MNSTFPAATDYLLSRAAGYVPVLYVLSNGTVRLHRLNSSNIADSTGTVTGGQWNYVSVTYDLASDAWAFNINGTTGGTDGTAAGSFSYFSNPLLVGNTLTGTIDELRISNSIRSDAWIKFEYYNVGQADHEIGFAAEEQQDTTNPSVSTLSPAANATGVSTTANLVITFDEAVDKQSGNITIKKSSDNSTVETIAATSGQVTGGGTDTITINPSVTLAHSTEYYVQIDATAFDDTSGNSYAGISDTTSWSFTTMANPDVTPPVLSVVYAVTTPTNDTTPNYTFSTTETGTIAIGGTCDSVTTSASLGSNTITLDSNGAGGGAWAGNLLKLHGDRYGRSRQSQRCSRDQYLRHRHHGSDTLDYSSGVKLHGYGRRCHCVHRQRNHLPRMFRGRKYLDLVCLSVHHSCSNRWVEFRRHRFHLHALGTRYG